MPSPLPPALPPLPAPGARARLRTPRLQLVGDGGAALAEAVHAYQRRNRAHFRPWDPPLPDSFHTLDGQAERVRQAALAFHAGSAWRWWLCPTESDPDNQPRVIGSIHFSQCTRGAFQNALLGYALDEAHVGLGLMTEALRAGIAEMFSPRVNLHRIQAAYRPENTRSAAVLARLGFEFEGLAREYLYIDGAWRDHRIVALRNPAFKPPAHW